MSASGGTGTTDAIGLLHLPPCSAQRLLSQDRGFSSVGSGPHVFICSPEPICKQAWRVFYVNVYYPPGGSY
jgi:hypothetical protein